MHAGAVQAWAANGRGGGRAAGELRGRRAGAGGGAARPDNPPPLYLINGLAPSKADNVVLRWNEELLQAIRANPAGTGPTVTARALGVAHTAMFDAWAAYDAWAVGTRYGRTLRRPVAERTPENKAKAISFAAYAALVDQFPSRHGDFALQMKELGYATDGSDTSMPATIGTMVARAVTDHRHKDGSNQLGGYADTTGYQPVNTPDQVIDRWRWQPLRVPLGTGNPPRALTPQWPTFSAAAAEAGQSRRYGGIHFPSGDLHGRSLGDAVGGDAWTRAQSYIRPFSPGPI